MPEPLILPPQEVSRRIVVGIGLVYDLFSEMNTLFRLIRAGLEDADVGIKGHGGKGYVLRRGRLHVTVADRFVRTDMGMFATIGERTADEDTADDEEDEAEEGAEEDDEPADRAQIAITPQTRFLGIRAVLYDRSLSDPLTFTPVLLAGAFSSFSRQGRQQQPESTFQMKGANVKRLVKQLSPGIAAGIPVATRIPRYDINARVTAVREIPLASLSSEADVQNFIDTVLEMIEAGRNP